MVTVGLPRIQWISIVVVKLDAKFGAERLSFTRAAGVPPNAGHDGKTLRLVMDEGVPHSTDDGDESILDRVSLGMTGLGSEYSGRNQKFWRRGDTPWMVWRCHMKPPGLIGSRDGRMA